MCFNGFLNDDAAFLPAASSTSLHQANLFVIFTASQLVVVRRGNSSHPTV